MKDVRRFENNQLYAIKAKDNSVRMRTKVAVLGGFQANGQIRPGFRVNMMSTEGVGGTAQVIRFERIEDCERWINQKRTNYGYDEDEISVMNSRAGEYVRLPLCDFDTDVYVNSIILGRFNNRTLNLMSQYCPEYIDDNIPNTAEQPERQLAYRGFKF